MKPMTIVRHPVWYLWPLPALLAYLAQRLLAGQPALVERLYTRHMFHWLANPIAIVTSLLPFSLTEVILILGGPLLLAVLILWIIRLVRRPGRLARTGRLLCRLAWLASLAYLAFMLLHGLNYDRLPVADSFSLPVRERNADELEKAAGWLVDQTNALRASRLEDKTGVFKLNQGIRAALRDAQLGYAAAAAEYPLLAGPAIRAKSVLLSHYWSYTGIAGVYIPFLVESNVNTDMPDYQIPESALHEIAHTRGFAREDEAGFIAFLSGIAHPDPDFAYSVVLDATIRCLNALYGVDQKAWERASGRLDKAVWRDLQAGGAYWKQFEGPVQTTSTKINDVYLQANLQDDGIQSYGRMVDLVLAWHESRLAAGTLDRAVASLAGPLPGASAD